MIEINAERRGGIPAAPLIIQRSDNINKEYARLLDEIKQRNIKYNDILNLLNINRQALSMKLHGKRNGRFSVEQAILIQQSFFPDIPIEVLFERK